MRISPEPRAKCETGQPNGPSSSANRRAIDPRPSTRTRAPVRSRSWDRTADFAQAGLGAQPGEPIDAAMEREDAYQARLCDGIGEEITQVGDGEVAAEGGPVETEIAVDPDRGEL